MTSFHGYLFGPENQFTITLIRAVEQQPGNLYNPLYLYGQAGSGKTSLINALAARLNSCSNTTVVVTSAQDLSNELYHQLSPDNSHHPFHRSCVIVENIQTIKSESPASQLLEQLCDLLPQTKTQLVVTGRDLSESFSSLRTRLRGRLLSGQIAELKKPTFNTKKAFLEHFAQSQKITLEPGVSSFLAQYLLQPTLTELQQLLLVLHDAVQMEKETLCVGWLKENLDPSRESTLTLPCVAQEVARQSGLTVPQLRSPHRTQAISTARQTAMFLARQLTSSSNREIGRYFNKRHASSVSHAYHKITRCLQHDRVLQEQLGQIRSRLQQVSHRNHLKTRHAS